MNCAVRVESGGPPRIQLHWNSAMATSRVFLLALACLTFAACGDAVSPLSEDAQFGIRRFGDPQPDSLRGPSTESSYIVVFRRGVADPAALTDQLLRTHGGRVAHR